MEGITLSYQYLRVWDCLSKVVVHMPKKVKIGPKTIDCAQNSNAYHFIMHESKIPDIHKNTIMKFRNASFFEHVFPYRSKEEATSSKGTHETMTGNS